MNPPLTPFITKHIGRCKIVAEYIVILDLLKTKMTNIASYVTCTLDRKAGVLRVQNSSIYLATCQAVHEPRPWTLP